MSLSFRYNEGEEELEFSEWLLNRLDYVYSNFNREKFINLPPIENFLYMFGEYKGILYRVVIGMESMGIANLAFSKVSEGSYEIPVEELKNISRNVVICLDIGF